MKIENINKEINLLIKKGTEEYKTSKKTKYFIDSEYNIVYYEAVELLLEHYNAKTEIEINKIFDEKIPKLFKNKECENVLTEFENLRSTDAKIRKQASKFFRQKALSETHGYRSMIFNRPDTFELLIHALKEENDEKILINLIIAIGGAYDRYFKYYKVYESLSPYLTHKKSEVRYYTILWTNRMSNKNRIGILNDVYKTEKSKKIRELIEQELKK